MQLEQITYSVNNGIATIQLNQPESLNSFTKIMLGELKQMLQVAREDLEVRVIILTGSGRAFCAGQNLRERTRKPEEPKPDLGESLKERYSPIAMAIKESPKPVIAAVNGVAAGAGANIALACDLVIAKKSASFLQAFTRIGLMPDAGGTHTLTRNAGRQRAMGMTLLAQPVSAEVAESWGLIWRAVEDEKFAEEVTKIATQLANGPSLAYAATKRAILAAESSDFKSALDLESDLQTDLGFSNDYEEGVLAFREKRKPNFTGS